jgi:hypothetical protein
MKVTGGCLCGAVRYLVSSVPEQVFLCYCQQCQKAQGTPFVASVPVAQADFQLTHGHALLKGYRATPNKARYFCGECGSPIYSHLDGNTVVRIRAGSFDHPPDLKIQAHIYTAGKVPWYEILDDRPRHDGREPGRA